MMRVCENTITCSYFKVNSPVLSTKTGEFTLKYRRICELCGMLSQMVLK